MRAACEAHDLLFDIWLTRPFSPDDCADAITRSGATGISLEAEIPAGLPQSVSWPDVVTALKPFGVSKSVVSNTAAFTDPDGTYRPDVAKPLIENGWHYLSECYLGESPHATPDAQDWTVRTKLGWPETQPVAGLQGGKTLADYPTLDSYRGWSVWAAEYLL